MSGDHRRLHPPAAPQRCQRELHRDNRRLNVARIGEQCGRPFAMQHVDQRDTVPQRIEHRGGGEDLLPKSGCCVEQLTTHTGRLRSLSCEQERDLWRRRACAPHDDVITVGDRTQRCECRRNVGGEHRSACTLQLCATGGRGIRHIRQ